jgi:hypothetical protein
MKFAGFRSILDERSFLLGRGAMLLGIWFCTVAWKFGSLIFKGPFFLDIEALKDEITMFFPNVWNKTPSDASSNCRNTNAL